MKEISIKIPQIGEGLQEARIVALLKAPGDTIARDEIIYQMETDKAVMDVEAPFAGRLVRWLIKPDDIVPIGADILVLEAEDVPSETTAEAPGRTLETVQALTLPQIGEGLQEARIVAFLKQPGETVARDEPIYQMETDKAVMDVESPFSGTLTRWIAAVDDVLPIGAVVGEISSSVDAGSPSAPVINSPTGTGVGAAKRRDISPRIRAYAKSKGLAESDLELVPAKGGKLAESDIDAYVSASKPKSPPASGKSYSEAPLPQGQRILASRLVRGNQLVVPGMMSVQVNWEPLEAVRKQVEESGEAYKPSAFTYFAFAVAKAALKHPIVRSTLVGDSTVRTYDQLHLGIAVSRPGDELTIAVVDGADSLDWSNFAHAVQHSIREAREGKDQAHEAVTLSITNMAGHGIRDAMAVVVPPAVVTVFVGEVHWAVCNEETPRFQRSANVGITLDHRLINGVGGAEFLQAVKHNVESIGALINAQ